MKPIYSGLLVLGNVTVSGQLEKFGNATLLHGIKYSLGKGSETRVNSPVVAVSPGRPISTKLSGKIIPFTNHQSMFYIKI